MDSALGHVPVSRLEHFWLKLKYFSIRNGIYDSQPLRRGARVVESTGLENRQACKRLVGSNPTPSATFTYKALIWLNKLLLRGRDHRINIHLSLGTRRNRLQMDAFVIEPVKCGCTG